MINIVNVTDSLTVLEPHTYIILYTPCQRLILPWTSIEGSVSGVTGVGAHIVMTNQYCHQLPLVQVSWAGHQLYQPSCLLDEFSAGRTWAEIKCHLITMLACYSLIPIPCKVQICSSVKLSADIDGAAHNIGIEDFHDVRYGGNCPPGP